MREIFTALSRRRATAASFRCVTGAITAAILLLITASAHAALIPPFFINSVVALGSMQKAAEIGQGGQERWFTEGTGFFYGELVTDDPDPLNRRYQVFLVTAKHVIKDHPTKLGPLKVRINPKDATTPIVEFGLPDQPTHEIGAWFYHPDGIDVAILPVDLASLQVRGYEPNFFAADQHVANRDKLNDIDVAAGDGIFVLGFPMNLAGVQRNYVIVRQGVIARISEMLDHASDTFLADTFVFPGNSGGPVVLKPDLTSINGTKTQDKAYLVGLVQSYHEYSDVATSVQTGQPRVVFQENSGLTDVLPADYIDETIKAWRSANNLDK